VLILPFFNARVRQMLGKELKWRLFPVRLNLEVYEALQRIAPEGDVKSPTKIRTFMTVKLFITQVVKLLVFPLGRISLRLGLLPARLFHPHPRLADFYRLLYSL